MALSDAAIKAAKPAPSAFKLSDERGLFLKVSPSGGKLWRLTEFLAKRVHRVLHVRIDDRSPADFAQGWRYGQPVSEPRAADPAAPRGARTSRTSGRSASATNFVC